MEDTGTPDGGPRAGSAPSWPLVLPLTLLVILGLAGLRGAVTRPRWNGPLRHDSLVIGLALEVILGLLLVLTYRRRSRAIRGLRRRSTTWPPSCAGSCCLCSARA